MVIREDIPVPEEPATLYMSEARPDGAIGGSGIEQLRAEVDAALVERGDRPEADGALSAAAAFGLREAMQGRAVTVFVVDAAARRFGFGGVVTGLSIWDETHADSWREQLNKIPKNVPITRYGIRVSPSGRLRALVFGAAEITYEPIPRAFEPGQSVNLAGTVGSRFTHANVFLTRPDGTSERKAMRDRGVAASFQLEKPGVYRLEVMGDGPTGPVIVSNVPLFVGVPEPALTHIEGGAVDPEEAEARALVLLNEARRVAGVNPLVPDPELRQIALAHSEDMVSHDFVGHVSPTTGTPDDRAHRAGVVLSKFGENVGTADTPEQIHQGLMDSPGHRAGMLDPAFTHVGIGADKSDTGLVLTMNFGRRPGASALPANATQVEAAIIARRASKDLGPPPTVDPVYRAAAQAAADAIANGDDPEEVNRAVQSVMQRELQRLGTSRPASCSTNFDKLLELSQLDLAPALFLPGLRRLGAGVRHQKDDHGVRAITVVMFDGVSCK